MSDYKVPLRDIAFSMNEVNDYGSHYLSYGGEIADSPELVAPIIEEVAKFVERVLAPINASGDREGAQWRTRQAPAYGHPRRQGDAAGGLQGGPPAVC